MERKSELLIISERTPPTLVGGPQSLYGGKIMIFKYKPEGVCSQEMIIDIENNIIKDLKVIGGCPGNLQGISKLVIGMNIDEVIEKLKGIKCGFRPTSCPDQLSKALEEYKKSNEIIINK